MCSVCVRCVRRPFDQIGERLKSLLIVLTEVKLLLDRADQAVKHWLWLWCLCAMAVDESGLRGTPALEEAIIIMAFQKWNTADVTKYSVGKLSNLFY